MKVLLLLFFVFLTPVFVFLLTLLYGGITSETVKKSLAEGGFYTNISQLIIENTESDDREMKQLNSLITDRFTPLYLQQKTELAIDDSYDWITGNSSVAPVISFSELKDDLLDKNPKLLKELEQMAKEAKKSAASADMTESQNDEQQQAAQEVQFADLAQGFNSLISQDFSFKLEPYLIAVKDFYSLSKILLPVTLVIMLGSLLFLGFICQDWKSRFKWIGSTLMVSGVLGFLFVVFNNLIIKVATNLVNGEEKGMVGMFGPVFAQVIKSILEANSNFQLIVSITLFIIAAGLFVAASMNNAQKAIIKTSGKVSPKK